MCRFLNKWFETRLVKSLFSPKAKVRLTEAVNSSMLKYIGRTVSLKWSDKKLLIYLEEEGKCVVTSDVVDRKRIQKDTVVFKTANGSSYQFCKFD